MTTPWTVHEWPQATGAKPRVTMPIAHWSKQGVEQTRCGRRSAAGLACAHPKVSRHFSHPRLPQFAQWASLSISFEKPHDGQTAVSPASSVTMVRAAPKGSDG